MLDLDSTSVCKECAMVCTELQYEDADEDQIVYGDEGINAEELCWEREDDRSTLDTEESEQQQLVYITNLKNGLQKDSMKLYDEEGPNEKKPAMENRLIEEPTLNNLNQIVRRIW